MMPNRPPSIKTLRKRRFLAALALAGLTQEMWCEREGITTTHLYLVLAGKRESQRLIEKIEAYTEETLSQSASAA